MGMSGQQAATHRVWQKGDGHHAGLQRREGGRIDAAWMVQAAHKSPPLQKGPGQAPPRQNGGPAMSDPGKPVALLAHLSPLHRQDQHPDLRGLGQGGSPLRGGGSPRSFQVWRKFRL